MPSRETSNSWQFIIFKRGNVSFWIPPGVLAQENVVSETKLSSVNFCSLTSQNGNCHCTVIAYSDSIT
ncbi:MAG: hypothetical protein ACTMUB_06460 [cyanobacterium endosymbiont of Rhopalodia musculus]|uniref:hypothetical protein n=1 Tax=cyanobacterium endosymbiont of Epithemia clementina EcSB TaxID=3034674 RepID=UPI002480EAA9|nr:hypothetical protein [cyanobacterium endosymbiont of Epithemia clementina EcSB]WGT67766.1 hypothetical protein P3F56_01310 [cyanobacterium endosymbiont of Epithemia clementina EcSB]